MLQVQQELQQVFSQNLGPCNITFTEVPLESMSDSKADVSAQTRQQQESHAIIEVPFPLLPLSRSVSFWIGENQYKGSRDPLIITALFSSLPLSRPYTDWKLQAHANSLSSCFPMVNVMHCRERLFLLYTF